MTMQAVELVAKRFEFIESMGYSEERTINEAYGYLMGVQDALQVEGEEFDKLSEIWNLFHMGHHSAYRTSADEWKKVIAYDSVESII